MSFLIWMLFNIPGAVYTKLDYSSELRHLINNPPPLNRDFKRAEKELVH